MKIGVGARPMGMGKAFVASADDASSIFMNPAGLASIKSWTMLSMYSNVLNDIPYATLAVATPFNLGGIEGALGIGAVGSQVTNIPSPSQTGFSYFDYHNNLYVVTAAAKLNEALSVGASAKVFDEGFTGSFAASGLGKDLDVGAKFTPFNWLSLGAVAQNVLPVESGGRMNWYNGVYESIPCVVKAGAAVNLLDNKLKVEVDRDTYVSRNVPSLMHAGVEWMIHPILILRGGIDQSLSAASDTKVSSDPTFGVGLRLGFIQVDYAYHPYHEGSENITHYVSVTLLPPSFGESLKTKTASLSAPKGPALAAVPETVPGEIVKPAAIAAKTILKTPAITASRPLETAAAAAPVPSVRAASKAGGAKGFDLLAYLSDPLNFAGTALSFFGLVSLGGLLRYRRVMTALRKKDKTPEGV
ncbi:MAG: hypothetical protein NTZ10_00910 [Candidatus Saganbacteria bacterium]|nr:hypothetical protein [Candidatus Saganbacteria bacterium]